MDRKMLRDDQWERIEQLLPGKASDRGCTAKDNRRFVEAQELANEIGQKLGIGIVRGLHAQPVEHRQYWRGLQRGVVVAVQHRPGLVPPRNHGGGTYPKLGMSS